jgi:hypothetical protein
MRRNTGIFTLTQSSIVDYSAFYEADLFCAYSSRRTSASFPTASTPQMSGVAKWRGPCVCKGRDISTRSAATDGKRHPAELGPEHVSEYLNHVAGVGATGTLSPLDTASSANPAQREIRPIKPRSAP